MNKFFITALFIVFFASLAFAGAPAVSVIQPSGSEAIKGAYEIRFTVTDSDANSGSDSNLRAHLYYSPTQGSFSNQIIDLNLMDTAVCVDQDFTSTNTCTYDWNTSGITDGNYFLDVNVADFLLSGELRDNGIDSSDASFYVDKTASSAVTLNASAGNAQVSLSWNTSSDGSGSGIKEYKVHKSLMNNFDANTENLLNPTTSTSSNDSNVINGTTYYYRIVVMDNAGNSSIQSNIVSATPSAPADTTAPSTSYSGFISDEWRKTDASITLNCSDSETGCKTINWRIDSGSWNNFNGTSVGFSITSEGDHLLEFYSIDNNNNTESTKSYRVKIDKTAPSSFSLSVSTNNSGEASLSWNSFSDPSPSSGFKEARIYRKTTGDYSQITSTTNSGTTSYTDTGLGTGTTYYYKIIVSDVAGNERESNEVSTTTPANECTANISLNVPSYVKEGTFTVKITSSSSLHSGTLSVCPQWSVSCTERTGLSGTSISKDFTIEKDDRGTISIEFIAYDSSGRECSKTRNITADAVAPTVEWVKPLDKTEIKDKNIALTVKIGDKGTNISELRFYQRMKGTSDWNLIEKVNNPRLEEMTRYWNATDLNEGEYELKASVEDRAENLTEKIISVTLGEKKLSTSKDQNIESLEDVNKSTDQNKLGGAVTSTLGKKKAPSTTTTSPTTGITALTIGAITKNALIIGIIVVIAIILLIVLKAKTPKKEEGLAGTGKGTSLSFPEIYLPKNIPKIISKKEEEKISPPETGQQKLGRWASNK